MKQIKIMAAAFTVFMLLALAAGLLFLGNSGFRERDISMYNDMIHRMYADWAAGAAAPELEGKYGCDIILSSELVDAELTKYYAAGALVLDFTPDGETAGKVVWNDRQEADEAREKQLRQVLLGFWGAVAVA